MEENVAAQLSERLAQLPEDVRNAVLSVEWEGKVQAIGARHQLHIDQMGTLGDVTLMAMLGMFDLAEYPTKVASELAIAPDLAATIAKEVSDEVFMTIRDSLHQVSRSKPAAAPYPAMNTPVVSGSDMPKAPMPAAAAPTAAPKPDLSAADAMLSARVVSSAPIAPTAATPAIPTPAAPAAPSSATPTPAEAPKPAAYTADPYREPPV